MGPLQKLLSGPEAGHSGYARRNESFENPFPDLPSQSSKFSCRTGEAKHHVEERIHVEPNAIAGNFMAGDTPVYVRG